jgi:hypothetical protein
MKKYHHLIPQTYFTPWQKNKGTLKIKDKSTGIITEKNKGKNFGINYFHSIMAGMPICTQQDADTIFQALKGLKVEYEGTCITNTLRMGELFYDFSNWIITEQDGSPISKKKRNVIYESIKQCKINEIEDLWSSKYETRWEKERAFIEQKIRGITHDCTIDAFQKGFLTKFIISLDWRSFAQNDVFSKAFDDINSYMHLDNIVIPEDERELPLFETGYEYMQHCILLKFFRDFLHDKGEMYEYARTCIKELSFCFLIAPPHKRFFTSDNPSFQVEIKEDEYDGYVGLFPISPKICLMQLRSKDMDNYLVKVLSDKEVDKYNSFIQQNASELIVL